MANITGIQVIQDGPKYVVVKLTGILDTSDVAATGTIGASGFTTTIGSRTVNFVAGALAPTLGQYVTFSDGTTTFPAGTYITAINSTTQIVVNNAALATNAAAAITITGTAGNVVLVDTSLLSSMGEKIGIPTKLIIDKISYNIEQGLAVNLYWDATTPILISSLVSSGDDLEFERFGGLWDNAGAGVTGKIIYTTQGWTASAVLSFNVVIEARKTIN